MPNTLTKADIIEAIRMKNIKKIIVIDLIIFLVAGIIAYLLGKVAVQGYGTILLLCGVVTMAIGAVSQAGSRHSSMSYSYRPKISVTQQHLRDKKNLQSNMKFSINTLIIGIVPVAIGLILMQLSY